GMNASDSWPWWHPQADAANLSPVASLIRAEARAAQTSDPIGELQRMLTMFRMPQPRRDQALYELAGFALAALQSTLQRAKRLHEVGDWKFFKAVERAADATRGPIDFVPMRRRPGWAPGPRGASGDRRAPGHRGGSVLRTTLSVRAAGAGRARGR